MQGGLRIKGSMRRVGDSYRINANCHEGDLKRLDNLWNGAFWILIDALLSIAFDRAVKNRAIFRLYSLTLKQKIAYLP